MGEGVSKSNEAGHTLFLPMPLVGEGEAVGSCPLLGPTKL